MSPRYVSTIGLHDMSPRYVSTICFHDMSPRYVSTICLHDMSPRYVFTICLHDMPAHVFTICLLEDSDVHHTSAMTQIGFHLNEKLLKRIIRCQLPDLLSRSAMFERQSPGD